MPIGTPTVLFTTPVLQHPPVGGPALRIENSIKALSRVCNLHLHCRLSVKAIGGPEAVSFFSSLCRCLHFDPLFAGTSHELFVPKGVNYLARRVLGRNLVDLERRVSFRHVFETADAVGADVIWLGYGNISYPLLDYLKQNSCRRVVVDTDSVWSRFLLRGIPYATAGREAKRIEKAGRQKEFEEVRGTRLADVTTAVSPVDVDYYLKLARHPRQVHIFSNAIDMESYRQRPPAPPMLIKPCLHLAGSFGAGSPMEDAARWVTREILPLVRQRVPGVHLCIVGSGSKEALADLGGPGVTVAGQVESVLPYLCHADIALVPLRFESGTRFKILEAGASGVPVVSTTLGAEGLAVTHGKDILLADDPQSFSDAITMLITQPDEANRLAINLTELVYSQYSLSSLAQEGRAILDYLLQR